MRELDRAVAELLEWSEQGVDGRWIDKDECIQHFGPFCPSADLNTIAIAKQAWCGSDLNRQRLFISQLARRCHTRDGQIDGVYSLVDATPEQLCRALVNAAKEIER